MVSFKEEPLWMCMMDNAAAAGAAIAASAKLEDGTLDNESMDGMLRWLVDDTVELVADDFPPFCFANRF